MQTENTYVETDLGNIALNPRGEYSDETSYEYLDTVSYMGGSYMCLAELTKTISGIAPAQGENMQYWQILTLPGQLTPEAVAMHDDVVSKAKQVETSRAAVELSQTEVEAAQTDVRQMRQDTQEASEEAAASRDSAAGYAQSAEISRTAAKESEDNVKAQESKVVQSVIDEGTKQIKAVSDKATEQIGAVNTAGSTQTSIIEAKGADQVKAIQKAGENALQNIGNGVDKGLLEEGKAADAKATGKAISKLTEDLSNKITKFYASNQGETHITDSDNGKIQDMMIYGKSSQDGTPSVENPIEIKSVMNPTVKVTNEDGLKVQSVTLNNITLNAIPVSSGGNVTINGQQYVADYVDVERGKVVRKINKLILTGEENWQIGFENWGTYPYSFRVEELKEYVLGGNAMNAKYPWYQKKANQDLNSMNAPYDRCIAVSDTRFSSVDEFINELKKQNSNGTPLIAYYVTGTPQEENLSLEEIKSLKSLSTYYPVTNISVNSEQLDGYTVFNYPISMQNGWNYVKQQLNDNRDYIYDMDTQSAEAYVNSEYAVALTELEV